MDVNVDEHDFASKSLNFDGENDCGTEGYRSLIEDIDSHEFSSTTIEVVNERLKGRSRDQFRRTDSNVSSSSLQDSSGLGGADDDEDGDDHETRDLFVLISNPEKHTTLMEAYITFKVTTKTTRSEYDQPEYSVRRRYNDFVWLREKLEETNQGHLIPPLPEKHSMRALDRFDPPFIKARQASLQRYLTRLADHPVLSFSQHFHIFLTAKAWEFVAHKKKGSGLLGRLTDSLHNMSAAYMMRSKNPDHVMLNQYVQTFVEKLGNVDRIAQRVVKEQTDYLTELREYGPIFTLWQSSEDELAQPLQATAAAVDKCCRATEDVIQATDKKFTQHVKEYILYGDAINAVLRRRDAIQMEYELTLDELNRKKEERDRVKISDQSYALKTLLGKPAEDVKRQKRVRIEVVLAELSSQVDMLSDRLVCADADVKADMERWHKHKRRDFRKIFVGMADRQIDYYQKCLSAWEQALPHIQKTEQHSQS